MDSYVATMGLEKFDIELDSVPAIYLPGKQVVGHVNVITKTPLHFQQIQVQCQGESTTFRTKSKLKNNEPKVINYKGHDVIYSDETTLLTGPQTAASSDDPPPMELHAGTYKLPFYFTLPPSCPGSFEGNFGSIRYYLKASINNSDGNVMHLIKHPFTVINVVDLNEDKDAGRRLSTYTTMTVPKNGIVTFNVKMKKKGFVPGEMVSMTLEVNNKSNKVMNGFSCQLQQMVTYFSWKDNQDKVCNWEENRVVAQLSKKVKIPVQKMTAVPWDLFPMPSVSPTLIEDSRLINVQYALTVSTTDLEPNITVTVPIIVGTIPLETAFELLKTARDQSLGPAQNLHTVSSFVPFTDNHSNLPIPHYTNTVFGSPDIRDQHDGVLIGTPLAFTPWNVLYDWTHIAQLLAAQRKEQELLAAQKRESETLLLVGKENKKSGRKTTTKGNKTEYVVNDENGTEKRSRSLFRSKKVKVTAKSPIYAYDGLDKATQTDYESDG